MPRVAQYVVVIVVFVGALCLVVGCSGRASEVDLPDGSVLGDLAVSPCAYRTGGGLFRKATTYEADCGTLVVPENHADPTSRLIGLPVIRIRALDADPGEPIFHLAGGPGGSNMQFQNLEGLIDRHDVVMVGYRGVDGTVVLDCPEMSGALRDTTGDMLSDSSLDRFAAGVSACGERLLSEGIDLAGYTVTDVAEDVETVRVALGYDRVNLLSESYGTRLAQIYAAMYPESLDRSIMISVNPPGAFVWEPEVIDAQIRYYAGLCAQDAACSARTSDLTATIRNVLQDSPRRWLFLTIDPDVVRATAFVMCFHTGSAAQVFDAFISAENGDPSGLATMSLMGDMLFPGMFTWGEFMSKGGSADYDPARDYRVDLDPPGSILGSPHSLLIWSAAAGWPVTLIPENLRQVTPTDVETLLVSGNIDFSTPVENATRDLVPALNHGHHVILSEFGHTGDVWSKQPEATRHLLVTYYDTGVVDDSLYTYAPVSFDVGLGFPELAKLAVGIMVLVVAMLVVGVRAVIRRARRRV